MIPKIIHYCWFGKRDKPTSVKKYIREWRHILPDYQFIEWNESNFDINSYSYTKEAYQHGKLAFVSDVARLQALYQMGGIYLDTDIEIKRPFDDLLNKKIIFGYEGQGKLIMTAFIAAEENSLFIKRIMDQYNNRHFIKNDGSLDDKPNTILITEFFESLGIEVDGSRKKIEDFNMDIYPEEFFSAIEYSSMREVSTLNTYTVHHFTGTWKPWYVRIRRKIKKGLYAITGIR